MNEENSGSIEFEDKFKNKIYKTNNDKNKHRINSKIFMTEAIQNYINIVNEKNTHTIDTTSDNSKGQVPNQNDNHLKVNNNDHKSFISSNIKLSSMSEKLGEQITPPRKIELNTKLSKSPGSNEIQRLKMIFENCTQKLQNSEDISNDINAFYNELSKLENVLDSPSRKKPIRRNSSRDNYLLISHRLIKPVIPPPPPPPPPPMFQGARINTPALQDVLEYNKNSLKTKKKQIVNKNLVPNSNVIDQLVEEFKLKANKNKRINKINTNIKRKNSTSHISPQSVESPIYKPFLRHVRRPDNENSIKKNKPSKIDFRKNLRTASRDPEFTKNLINEIGSNSNNRRYTMSYLPKRIPSITSSSARTATPQNSNVTRIPISVKKSNSIHKKDSIHQNKHYLINKYNSKINDNIEHSHLSKGEEHKNNSYTKNKISDIKNTEKDDNHKTIIEDKGSQQHLRKEELNKLNEDNNNKINIIDKNKNLKSPSPSMNNTNNGIIASTHSKGILESIRERPKISKDLINQKLKHLNKTDKEAINRQTLSDADAINFDSQSNVEIDTTSLFSNSTYSRICRIKQSFEQNSLNQKSNNDFEQKDSISRFTIKERERKQSLHRRRLSSPRKLSFNLYNGYNYNYIKKQPYRRYSDSFDLNKLPKISYHPIKRSSSLLYHPPIKVKDQLNKDNGTITARLSLNPTSSVKLTLSNNKPSLLLSHNRKPESLESEGEETDFDDINENSISNEVNHDLEVNYDDMNVDEINTELDHEIISKEDSNLYQINIIKEEEEEEEKEEGEKKEGEKDNKDEGKVNDLKYKEEKEKGNIIQNTNENLKSLVKQEIKSSKINITKENKYDYPLRSTVIQKEREEDTPKQNEFTMRPPTSLNYIKKEYTQLDNKNKIKEEVEPNISSFKRSILKTEKEYIPAKKVKIENKYTDKFHSNGKIKSKEDKLNDIKIDEKEEEDDSYINRIIKNDEEINNDNNISDIKKKRNLTQTSFDFDLRKKRRDNNNQSVLVLNSGSSTKDNIHSPS
ncbi:hypothetical protein H8356DRAFT_943275 [Neocallimastix lanati (nom. inval.)]|uniref:Uncharacterized protein n=1 Tax=Neocallimastix californiae TaxID=1754190 RepID=A0A1Y2E8N2_9FUNG|nr:hypothetical protein H8356DRAFT_943275 [Neocallimastix sp. JGI-2020a]ORY67910.1 hypothetical protein LY90DRAFT_667753 [Neocallimastix californiae]|eukprot:ORY67910.1 hypothetical protein LY90DRAFT_667753 [Neocallimastix californiae]